MFKASPVYAANYMSNKGIVVNQGGSSSGKTYSILQCLFKKISEKENQKCVVVGQDIPNLKAGALRDALEIYDNNKTLQALVRSYNKSDRIFTLWNKSIMEFKSYSDFQDAKSGKRQYLFINEANGIPYPVYHELSLRTTVQEFIDYNPNSEFWVHEKLIGQEDTQLIISDHRHNPFLVQKTRDKLEGLKEKDYELWKVYARGLTGKIEGLIFRNWKYIDAVPTSAKLIAAGLDFGFTNDPTACPYVYVEGDNLYIDEKLYLTGLTNPDIKKHLEEAGHSRHTNIVADSAEPKSIEELRRMGLSIEASKKGPDSILASIDVLKRYNIFITRRSTNTTKEFLSYKWRVDKISGKSINEPVDFLNHIIDAVRYVALNYLNTTPGRPRFTITR